MSLDDSCALHGAPDVWMAMPCSTDTAVTIHRASRQTMPAPGLDVLRPGAVFPQMGTGAITLHIRAAPLLDR